VVPDPEAKLDHASLARRQPRVIPPLLHGYADIAVTVALIVLPFIVGFSGHTTALVFYLIVGIGGLLATLATRFEPRMQPQMPMRLRRAA